MEKQKLLCLNCGETIKNKRNKLFCSNNCQTEFKSRKSKRKDKIIGLKKTAPRNQEIKVRVSVREKKKIKEKANKLGLKSSQYMRIVALHSIQIPEQILL